jgi:autophagy-related protein 2
VDVIQAQLRITACADSLATLGALVGDVVSGMTGPKPYVVLASRHNISLINRPLAEPVQSPTSLDQSVDVFGMSDYDKGTSLMPGSIEEDAFRQIPDISSGADLIEDDLPTNLDYLDTATRPRQGIATDRTTGESLRSWQATHDDGSADVGETVKVLLQHFEMDENYWDNLPDLEPGYGNESVFAFPVKI